MGATLGNPITLEGEREGEGEGRLFKIEASLFYTSSSRPARAIQQDPPHNKTEENTH